MDRARPILPPAPDACDSPGVRPELGAWNVGLGPLLAPLMVKAPLLAKLAGLGVAAAGLAVLRHGIWLWRHPSIVDGLSEDVPYSVFLLLLGGALAAGGVWLALRGPPSS